MKIIDIINSQWAITKDAFDQILFIFGEHKGGPKIDLKSMEAAVLKYDPGQETTRNEDNTAIVSIHGPLMKRPSVFERVIFGAVGMQDVQSEIQSALDDPGVDLILLDIDSPGGTVDGTKELADFIYNARSEKKIIAYSDGMIASAGYWIAAAAEEIYITNETVEVGSVGVRLTHVDYSAANEAMGVKITEFFAGKYKTAGSPDKPLDPDSKEYLQASVDKIYSLFVNDVAKYRGLSVDYVVQNIADARLYMGSDAVNNKLVDGVSTLNTLIGDNNNMKNIDEYKSHDFFSQVKDEISKEIHDELEQKFNADLEIAKKEALENERKRISDINALSLPGYEKVISEAIESGIASEAVGIQIIKAQKEDLSKKAENFDNDGPEVLPEVEPVIDVEPEEKDFLALIDEYSKEHKCSKSEARRAVISENVDAYNKYLGGLK